MQADLIFVGGELLTGLVENSNAGYLSRRLWATGIPVREQRVVSDETLSIAAALESALIHSDIVILTGGLGPTDDDLTREGVSLHLGLPLILNQSWLSKIEKFFLERGYSMPANNRKQAMLLQGSLLLDNPRGTAPGSAINYQGKLIVMLPGPPQEMQPMFEREVLPLLTVRSPQEIYMTKTIKCAGLGESLLEEKIKSVGEWVGLPLSLIARGMEVHLQVKVKGTPETARTELDTAVSNLRSLLGEYIFGEDDDTLQGAVAKLLTQKQLTVGVAESCSGGALSDMITDIAGSSQYFKGSVVAYSNAAKEKLLHVDGGLIKKEGPVSKKVTEALAQNVAAVLNADLGIAITGLAGPDSDETGKPVGLSYVAVAWGEIVHCRENSFRGTRRAIKERAAQTALIMVRELLKL